VPLTDQGAEFLFQVIAERAEKATVIMSANLPFAEWTQVILNPRLCKALLDRGTGQAYIIETGADTYRFRKTLEKRQKKDPERGALPLWPSLRPPGCAPAGAERKHKVPSTGANPRKKPKKPRKGKTPNQ
jgi:hypothetical protein